MIARLFPLLVLAFALPAGLPAHAQNAEPPEITGTWKMVERDPLFGREDDVVGKYAYDMEISPSKDGYVVTIPRTGARFLPAPLKAGVLRTRGSEPDRGAARLELRFFGFRVEGAIDFASGQRTLSGDRDPRQLVETAQRLYRDAQAETARRDADLARLEAALDRERQQGLELRQALEAETARRTLLEKRLATALNDLAGLRAARPAAPPAPAVAARPAPPPPGERPVAGVPTAPLIVLIEPPLADGEAETDSPRPAALEVVARIDSDTPLMSLRINERPARTDENGLFRLAANLPEEGGEVRIVAIDINGGRSERRFRVRPAAPPPLRAAIRDDRDACYELGVATDPPAELALDACREAIRLDPDEALNHYHLGVVLSRLGQHDAAIRAYREAAARWTR